MLSLIVAHDENRLIGVGNDLPWRLPNDLANFKRITTGKIVLMGRKTWDSLPKKPLPNRENWVLSRNPHLKLEGARCFTHLADAIQAAEGKELLVIGGAELYTQALALAKTLYVTEVLSGIAPNLKEGVYFPVYRLNDYRLVEEFPQVKDDRHALPYTFKILEKK